MQSTRTNLLSSAMAPALMGLVIAAGSTITLAEIAFAATSEARTTENPAAVARPAQPRASDAPVRLAACNPCAAKKACNPCAAKACNPCAAKACNPCAAKKACNPCNPCAAKACNPCAARACNPCNPCGGAAAGVSASCQVPRLVTAALCNPCAARKACSPCNPCAAKACNPCAAKRACNPCGAKACNPCAAKACNPCAAKRACNPCAAKACNPCAAKTACAACNPCAAKKACGPCNPCAAKKACSPCNPCAASACNPCSPCGGAKPVELTTAEARSVYDCLLGEMKSGYAKSGMATARLYTGWDNYATQPYVSATHGSRYVNNYGNAQAASYKKYEDVGRLPVGAILAKDSFVVRADGKVAAGPLFLMEKMPAGFLQASDNWRYSMIMPTGAVFGVTNGKNSAGMNFCYECHMAVAEDQDSLMFLPEEYRKH